MRGQIEMWPGDSVQVVMAPRPLPSILMSELNHDFFRAIKYKVRAPHRTAPHRMETGLRTCEPRMDGRMDG